MSMQEEFLEKDSQLIELLFESNLPVSKIAETLEWSQAETSKRIRELGLTWVRRGSRKMSRGHASLTSMVTRLLPGVEVVNEHHIGERLMLDIYCPKYKLAIEFHGRQHFEFNNFFYKSYDDFRLAQERDIRKEELCKRQGITLVTFCYNERLTEDDVFNRILHAIKSTPNLEDKVPANKYKMSPASLKGNPVYEEAKRKRKEWEKDARIRMKAERQNKYN